ncbi:MAG: antirestriction protein ArdA [Bacteroidales bacterium]|nr:antirestriction protein ArdA [Bacteroidales bacterium]
MYSLDNFEEAYCGEWDSEEDFARHIIEECYTLELRIAECLLNKRNMKQKMMGSLANYFDYEAFARELFNWDYNMGANGHVFRRI